MATVEKTAGRERLRRALVALHLVFLFLLLLGALALRSALVPVLAALLFAGVIAGLMRRVSRIPAIACAAALMLFSLYSLSLILVAAETVLPAPALAPLIGAFAGLALFEAGTIAFFLL